MSEWTEIIKESIENRTEEKKKFYMDYINKLDPIRLRYYPNPNIYYIYFLYHEDFDYEKHLKRLLFFSKELKCIKEITIENFKKGFNIIIKMDSTENFVKFCDYYF